MQARSIKRMLFTSGLIVTQLCTVPSASAQQYTSQSSFQPDQTFLEESLMPAQQQQAYGNQVPQYANYQSPMGQTTQGFNGAQYAPAEQQYRAPARYYGTHTAAPVYPTYAAPDVNTAPYIMQGAVQQFQSSSSPQYLPWSGNGSQIIIIGAPAAPQPAPAAAAEAAQQPQPSKAKTLMTGVLGLGKYMPGKAGAAMTHLQPVLDAWMNRSDK